MVKRIVLLLLFFVPVTSFSQKPPIKFGKKIAIEDLKMTVYDKDTTAEALILCDYGHLNGNNFSFTRILRVKILKKEGMSWGNQVFGTGDRTSISGYTYNLVNGKIEKEKLSRKNIIRVHVHDDDYDTRIAMPNVKVGSIIEIKFFHPGLPSEWKFQHLIPVRHSELRIDKNPNITYSKNWFGFISLDISEYDRWVGYDIPAFIPEPYTNSSENYIAKFEFDIQSIFINGYHESFSTDWNTLSNKLIDAPSFGGAMRKGFYIRKVAEDIEAAYSTDEEKIKAAFDSIKQIKWNGYHSLWAGESELRFCYRDKLGNSAEINMMLLQVLRDMGYNVKPVALSTRQHGLLSPIMPSYGKLNHMIVFLKTADREYLLDATEEYAPYTLLPFKDLNWRGRIIGWDNSEWIDLQPTDIFSTRKLLQFTLDENLNVEGKVNSMREGYAACNFRKDYHTYNSQEEYLNNMVESYPGLEVTSCKIENLDILEEPVKDSYDVKINGFVQDLGDEVIVQPFFHEQMKENPFKTTERMYPVNFGYEQKQNLVVQIIIPDGYSIAEVPEPVKLSTRNNGCELTCLYSVQPNMLIISYSFAVNKDMFLPEEYESLREFYNQVIKIQSQPVILKKI